MAGSESFDSRLAKALEAAVDYAKTHVEYRTLITIEATVQSTVTGHVQVLVHDQNRAVYAVLYARARELTSSRIIENREGSVWKFTFVPK